MILTFLVKGIIVFGLLWFSMWLAQWILTEDVVISFTNRTLNNTPTTIDNYYNN